MKKKLVTLAVALLAATGVSAQFERGKAYVAASLSGVGVKYNGADKGSLGFQAKGGYLFADDMMVTAQLGYDKQNDVPASYSLGAGFRYYIVQNGLYLGASACYKRRTKDFNDFMPSVQAGYAFFLNQTVTVEPEVYYEQSFKNHSDYSTIGFRIGVGVYL